MHIAHHTNTMIGYVLLACFATAVFGGSVSHPPKKRIAGSHNVDIQQYPYHVQLHQDPSPYGFGTYYLGCNGAIISPKHVVTTASCIEPHLSFDNQEVDVSTVVVKVNSSYIDEFHQYDPWTFIKVKNHTLHPYYSNASDLLALDYNIAVLELAETLQYGVGIQQIGLPKPDEYPPVGSVLSVTGFGAGKYGEEMNYHTQMQALQLVVVQNTKCTEDFIGDAVVTDRQMCTGSLLGKDGEGPCKGDKGSPAAFEGVLQGLYTFGDCGYKGHGSVYTSVASLVGFVNDAIAASNQIVW